MENISSMNRLLDGDVGSGKTVVAMLVAYNALINDQQLSFIAPTTLLDQQHLLMIKGLITNNTFSYYLLTQKDTILYKNSKKFHINYRSSLPIRCQ